MKAKSIFVLTAVIAMAFWGCKENPYITSPGDNTQNTDTIPEIADPTPTPDPEGVTVPEGTINVNEAFKIGKSLQVSSKDSKYPTDKAYFIKGWVVGFNEEQRAKTDFAKYGNDFVYLSARNDGKGAKQFYCYRIMGPKGNKLPDYESIVLGDFVVVKCKILNFGGTIENDGDCWTVASNNAHFNEVFADALLPEDTIYATCAEAKTAALALASGGTSKDVYIVEGYVQSAGYSNEISNGQQKWFWLDDTKSGNKVLEAYWCNVPDGATPIPVGAKIRLTGHLMNYNGNTAEIKNGDIEILEDPQ